MPWELCYHPVAKPMPGKALMALRFWPAEEGGVAPKLLGFSTRTVQGPIKDRLQGASPFAIIKH